MKDVTRRYAKAYNAKTRKLRVNATKGGEKWWNDVVALYYRGNELVSYLPIYIISFILIA